MKKKVTYFGPGKGVSGGPYHQAMEEIFSHLEKAGYIVVAGSCERGELLNSSRFVLSVGGIDTINAICEFMEFVNLSQKIWQGQKKLAILFLEAGKENNILVTAANMILFSNLISDETKKSIKICLSPEEATAFVLS